ncbi:polypyrimidine tract-binding protein 2-like isoform x1 [Nannochloropsis oceanica]
MPPKRSTTSEAGRGHGRGRGRKAAATDNDADSFPQDEEQGKDEEPGQEQQEQEVAQTFKSSSRRGRVAAAAATAAAAAKVEADVEEEEAHESAGRVSPRRSVSPEKKRRNARGEGGGEPAEAVATAAPATRKKRGAPETATNGKGGGKEKEEGAPMEEEEQPQDQVPSQPASPQRKRSKKGGGGGASAGAAAGAAAAPLPAYTTPLMTASEEAEAGAAAAAAAAAEAEAYHYHQQHELLPKEEEGQPAAVEEQASEGMERDGGTGRRGMRGGGGRGGARGRGGGRGRGRGGRTIPSARYDRLLGSVQSPLDLRPGTTEPSNVLLARIAEGLFPITLDALYTLFSFYGPVQKLVMFNKGAGNQALVQYPDVASAQAAYEQVDRRNMYTDSNLIRVGFSTHQDIKVRANTDRTWDYTKKKDASAPATSTTSTDTAAAGGATTSSSPSATASAAAAVVGPVDSWSTRLPGTDTCVLVVQGLNMEMVGAEALAALFGLYGDVRRVKMMPEQESALVEMEKPVQAYVAKWLLDASPLGGRIIKVKPSTQESIRDAHAQDFTSFPLHGYRQYSSPRNPSYLSNLIEPTAVLRVANIAWDTSESEFRGLLTQQEGVSTVTRLLPSSHTSPALISFQSVEAAVHACILLHNQEVNGKLLYVTFSDATPGI